MGIDSQVIEAGVKVLGLSVVAKVFEGPIGTLNDIWGLCGGDKIKLRREKHIEDYSSIIAAKVQSIPLEKIQEPKLSILGPALEASKFYIEEEEIRELFANLISKSMNSDYNDSIPHSFVEIIKQLSPHDALLFKEFHFNNAFVELVLENEKNESWFYKGYCYITPSFMEDSINSISLVNLEKQGLIKIFYGKRLIDVSLYSIYDSLYLRYDKPTFPKGNDLPLKLVMKKHSFELTSLGNKFIEICCN